MLQLRLAAIGLFLIATVPAAAHHTMPPCNWSDANSEAPSGGFTGKILSLGGSSMHAMLSIEIKDVNGSLRKPQFDLGPMIAQMQADGLPKTALKAGESVTVLGCLSKRQPDHGVAWVVIAAGKKLIADRDVAERILK